jgi:hypothetical protein
LHRSGYSSGELSAPSCTLSAGTSSVTYTPTAVDTSTHPLSAAYSGDTNHGRSSSSTNHLTVTTRPSNTSVVGAPATETVGVASTCTATVSDTAAGTTSTPTGTVAFTHTVGGDLSASSCTLSAGSCSVTYTPTAVDSGTHTVTGAYGGDTTHVASRDSDDVTSPSARPPATIVCAPTTLTVGDPTTAPRRSRTPAPAPSTPAGSVSFAHTGEGMLASPSCTLVNGACTVAYTPAATGTHVVTAAYAGAGSHASAAVTAAAVPVPLPPGVDPPAAEPPLVSPPPAQPPVVDPPICSNRRPLLVTVVRSGPTRVLLSGPADHHYAGRTITLTRQLSLHGRTTPVTTTKIAADGTSASRPSLPPAPTPAAPATARSSTGYAHRRASWTAPSPSPAFATQPAARCESSWVRWRLLALESKDEVVGQRAGGGEADDASVLGWGEGGGGADGALVAGRDGFEPGWV